MKGIIVYKGKYGATRQYAEWVGEELKLPVLVLDNLKIEELLNSDFVVIGSSVYFGKMLLSDWLKKNAKNLQNKIIFLFVVCGTPSSEKEKQQHILEDNLPVSLLNSSRIFFLPGRLIRKELSWSDRLLVKIGASFEKDPVRKKAMLEDIDGVKKENLAEIFTTIRSRTLGKDAVIDDDVRVYDSNY
jgi:menaquinone-dependent protoporphyrinogen IX oxidase